MLDILGLIFVGAAFNHLAHIFDKSRVLYVLLGLGIYFLSTIAFHFVINILIIQFKVKALANMNNFLLVFIVMGMSFGICLLSYKAIKRSFIRRERALKEEVLDQGT